MHGGENGWIVVLAGPVLHLEEIASLAHLLPLLSAVIISMAKSNLTDVIYKTLKLNRASPLFYLSIYLFFYLFCGRV